ncbi:MAG TPA: hypothetical protein VNF47_14865 [Streptosporangiaceae bacterium]|nr:hypothetical protein [Streptosporangiaceae bacterium]
MPCYRCGTRQVDPDRGSSPWLRGVRADRQVLICPGCQAGTDWTAELDRCRMCGSVHLVRRLGEVECRDCGAVGASIAGAGDAAATGAASRAGGAAETGGAAAGVRVGAGAAVPYLPDVSPGLAEEVEQALARVLRRTARSAGIG